MSGPEPSPRRLARAEELAGALAERPAFAARHRLLLSAARREIARGVVSRATLASLRAALDEPPLETHAPPSGRLPRVWALRLGGGLLAFLTWALTPRAVLAFLLDPTARPELVAGALALAGLALVALRERCPCLRGHTL